MTYAQLVEFLENKMTMSHVYQPLLIRALVDSGGAATIRQLAQLFLSRDESQLLYYEKRITKMTLRVLKRHGIVTGDGQLDFASRVRPDPRTEGSHPNALRN